MTFGAPFGRIFAPPFSPRTAAPASGGWWLAGGIAPANCVAAYQAKGAASYATSLVNLANPGTYNATEGDAPDWDAVSGWKFNGSSNYLDSGVVPAAGWSMIVRFSNVPAAQKSVCGCTGTPRFYLRPYHLSTQRVYGYGSSALLVTTTISTSGVMALVGGDSGFYDGVNEGSVNFSFTTTTSHVFIGKGYDQFFGGYVQAFALYDTNISSYISALTTAMNAL